MKLNTSRHYASKLWNNYEIDLTITKARELLCDVNYDAFIGCGISSMMACHLAKALDKELAIVRKINEATHSGDYVEGYNRFQRGIIVDDFIDTGTTIEYIKSKVDVQHIVGILLYEADGDRIYKEQYSIYKTCNPA